jgi:hypothetical protein
MTNTSKYVRHGEFLYTIDKDNIRNPAVSAVWPSAYLYHYAKKNHRVIISAYNADGSVQVEALAKHQVPGETAELLEPYEYFIMRLDPKELTPIEA